MREQIAAMALQGLLTNSSTDRSDVEGNTNRAVEYADALLEKLMKTAPATPTAP